ncbi:MAG: TonB-dependent receptor [bacterium]
MRRLIFLICILFATVLLESAYPGNTGKISGTVTDYETGLPLFAVNVTIQGTGLGAITNLEGFFYVINVPPGKYSVKASMMGYQSITIDNVTVNADFTTLLEFALKPAVLDIVPEIVVTAERPMIRKDLTSSLSLIEHREIAMLPIESPFDIVAFQPGATIDRRGLHVRGGRSTEISYAVNGAVILDPIFSRASASYDESAVQEMVVLTGGFTPEYGNAQSAIVNIITKEGGLDFEAEVGKEFYLPMETLWRPADDARKYNTGYNSTRFSISGPSPLTKNLRYFLSGETSRWDDWDPHVYVLPNQGRYLDQLIWKFTGIPTKDIKLFTEGLFYDSKYRVWDARRQKVPETFLRYHRETVIGLIGMSHMISRNTYYDIAFSRLQTRYHVAQPGKWYVMSKSQEWNTTPREEGGGGLNLQPEYDENNFVISGDNPLFHRSESVVYTGKGSVTSQINENHQAKLGFELSFYNTSHQEIYAPAGNIYRNQYEVKPWYGAFYFQDKIEYSGMIVNAGLRLDMFDPNYRYPSDEVYPWDPSIEVPGPECGGPDNTEPPLWNLEKTTVKYQISPRLGISHPVSDRTVLHFSYGHYHQIPPFGYLYTNTRYDMGGYWPLVGNPQLKPERTVSYEAGVEHLIDENLKIDLTGFYKDIHDLISTVVINDSRDPSTPPDATEYTTYKNTDWGNVRGFEISLQRKLSEEWMGRLSYTFMVAKGRSSDVLEGYHNRFEGNVPPSKEYYLDWDRRHTILFDLGYGRSDRWSINVLLKYASGAPYTPVENTRSRQPEQNTARFPSTSIVNLRAAKYLNLFGLREQLYIQVENLFNKRNLVAFDDENTDFMRHLRLTGEYTGPYNDVTVYGSPREIRGGFEIGF